MEFTQNLQKEAHEIANIFPMMNETDFENLKKDIQENGFDEERSILLYENKILDGRNRNRACQELGIEPIFRIYEGEDPLYYVISNNLNRRHLNESQRTIVAMRMANMKQGERTDIEHSANWQKVSQEKASELMHIGVRQISRAKELFEKSPEVIERIERGETNIGREYGLLKQHESLIPHWVRYLDVWTFSENTGDGLSNLPPEIIKNLLYYYTIEGDVVFDCFGGSGLTYKVCKDMKRECIISDLNPREDYIIKWNVDNGFKNFPEDLSKTKLVFLDPPYFDMVDYGEGWSDTDIKDFFSRVEILVKNLKDSLPKDSKIALIIMPLERDGEYLDLGFKCSEIFLNNGFIIDKRLCVPLIRNWSIDARLKKSKEEKKILVSSLRDLIIFKNGN